MLATNGTTCTMHRKMSNEHNPATATDNFAAAASSSSRKIEMLSVTSSSGDDDLLSRSARSKPSDNGRSIRVIAGGGGGGGVGEREKMPRRKSNDCGPDGYRSTTSSSIGNNNDSGSSSGGGRVTRDTSACGSSSGSSSRVSGITRSTSYGRSNSMDNNCHHRHHHHHLLERIRNRRTNSLRLVSCKNDDGNNNNSDLDCSRYRRPSSASKVHQAAIQHRHRHAHAPETFHVRSYMDDSIKIQTRRSRKVLDDEEHEEHPHLQDFLRPHHFVRVVTGEGRGRAAKITAEEETDDEEGGGGDDDDDDEQKQQHQRQAAAAAGQVPRSVPLRSCLKSSRVRDENRTASSSSREKKKMVTYHEVTRRDYAMTLGDHPNCSYGPPVMLSWDYLEYAPLTIDEYEIHHARRRTLRQMNLNYYKRKNILKFYCNFTDEELKSAWGDVKRDKRRRALTKWLLPVRKVEEVVESAGRKLRRNKGGSSSSNNNNKEKR